MQILKYTTHTTPLNTKVMAVLSDGRKLQVINGKPVEYLNPAKAREKVRELNKRLKQKK